MEENLPYNSAALDFRTWQETIGDWIIETQRKRKGGQAMSQGFRALNEIWNVHSSCFMEPEKLIVLLHDLAARVGTESDEHEYGNKQALWLENGRKVLDYMEAEEHFSEASSRTVWKDIGIAVNRDDLISLIDNMRSLSKQWRGSVGTRRTGVLRRCLLNPADVTFTQAEKENPAADCNFKLSFQPG
jgi:hypothetical protein